MTGKSGDGQGPTSLPRKFSLVLENFNSFIFFQKMSQIIQNSILIIFIESVEEIYHKIIIIEKKLL